MESQAGLESFEPLRLAIVLDSLTPPAWVADAATSVLGEFSPQAVVVLPARPNLRHSFLFENYLVWDGRRNQAGPDPLAPVDVSALFAKIPRAALDSLDANLDVLLWLSEANPTEFAIPATRYGVWFFAHGRAGQSVHSAAYFVELLGHHPVSASHLMALTNRGQLPIHVAEAYTASEIGWSLARHRIAPLWKAATLPAAALHELRTRTKTAQQTVDLPRARLPSNSDVLRFAARNITRTVERRIRYSNKDSHWFVSYRTNREDFVANKGQFTPVGFQTLPTPPGHFYADPFVLTWQNRTFLFVEDYLYAEARGVLSVLEFFPGGHFSPAAQILNRPYHLSYPFVFAHDGEVFMIPETMGARRIELYRALEMPRRWELVKVLQEDVEAVDTTLWIEDGVFYFFTNLVRPGMTPNDLLFLFTADSLTGHWHPHPANPISRDVRAARGAGKLFHVGDKLVRPAQDCSVRYGYATQLNHVEMLTPERFREKPLLRIEPDWAPHLIGTHTINSNDTVEVIDGQVYQTRYRSQPEES